jgi:hypothetical protein
MKLRTTLAIVLAVIGATLSAQAQGTAFFYQGRLNQSGNPVTGIYDFRFTIYDSLAGPTVVAGPLPQNSVGVTNGLFTTALDFGAGIFTGPGRWLEIAVRTNGGPVFTNLTPRQPLLPTPYAIHSGTASNVANGSVVKSLNALRDNVTLAAGANVTLATNGNTLTLSSTGAGGNTNIWNVSGTNTYYNSGNVGIGTATPSARLYVVSPTAAALDNTATFFAPAIGPNASHIHYGTSGDWVLRSASSSGKVVLQDSGGNVGIGATAPAEKLDVRGNLILDPGGSPTLYTAASGGEQNRYLNLINSPSFSSASGLKAGGLLVSDSYGFADPGKNDLIVKGSVGIGTASLVSALEIDRQDALRIRGFQPFLTLSDTAGFGLIRKANRYLQVVDGDLSFLYRPECNVFPCTQPTESHMTIRFNGNVGIGTTTPQAKLHVIGTVRTSVLTITGGADIAEPFEMSSSAIPKGSVVVIDERNPGHLKLSTEAYDTRVAGVVSGANGIQPGISLHQEGSIEGGENVALSGRVYVQADATTAAIRPGDLLTTSETPGHAMKVNDHAKSQGAILGKAMTALAEGKGMVLVLVTLQ